MKREQYIEIAKKAGFEIDADGNLYLYGRSPMLMKPNYQGTLVDGMKAMVDIAIQDHCERMAKAIEKMPFGDTSQSFAIFVREFK